MLKSAGIVPTNPLGHVAAVAIAAMAGCSSGGSRTPPADPGAVAGRYFMTLGDADVAGDALGGLLADRRPGGRDALTVVSLPIREPVTPSAQVEVGNSSLGSPACIAASADGRRAFVVETFRPGPDGTARPISSLPVGDSVASVDLSDPLSPRLVATAYVGPEPRAVAVHPAGDLLAIVTRNPRNQIVIASIGPDGRVGEPATWPLLGLDDDQAEASSLAWHPSGRALAVVLPDRGQVVLYAFSRADGLALATWGAPVTVPGEGRGGSPRDAVFTRDGRRLLVLDAARPHDAAAPSGSGNLHVLAISPNLDEGDGSSAIHSVLGSAPAGAGVAPVGLALSPDGSMAVVACSQSAAGAGGALLLYSITREGALVPRGEYPIGAVPAGVSFDAAGRFVLASQYRSLDPDAAEGEVSFWRVLRGPDGPALEQADFFIGIGSGPHSAIIVR